MTFKSKSAMDFFLGLIMGMILTVVLLLLYRTLETVNILSRLNEIYQWLRINLGFSAPLFCIILLTYGFIWQRINKALFDVNSQNWKHIVHDEQLLDMLTGLAFGVGVIWTAIGMREALIAAFGHDDMTGLVSEGALGMLEQLINGGILTALTSTVVGGVMGYLLRILKALSLASRISEYQGALQKAMLVEEEMCDRT